MKVYIRKKRWEPGDKIAIGETIYTFIEYTDYGYACMMGTFRDDYGSEFNATFYDLEDYQQEELEIDEVPYYIPYD